MQHHVEAVLTRADHASGTDRLAEVATVLGLPDDAIVVNVQGDEPLIAPTLIDNVAAHLRDHPDCAIATAAHPIHDPADVFNPNVVKVVLDAADRALLFSRAPLPSGVALAAAARSHEIAGMVCRVDSAVRMDGRTDGRPRALSPAHLTPARMHFTS